MGSSRLLLAWALCAACAPALRYQRFEDVPYPYPSQRQVWSPRAGVWVHTAEVPGPAEATPVLLLHPWGTNMLAWSEVAPALAAERRVLLLDLPGHGKSSKPPGSYPVKRMALAALDVLDAYGVPRVHAAGNSLGGSTALELALRAPERVGSLVLMAAPGGRPVPEVLRRMAYAGTTASNLATLDDGAFTVSWWLVAPSMPPLAVRMRDDVLALRGAVGWTQWTAATSSALREVARYSPRVEDVRARTLVVAGERDRVVPSGSTAALAERIAGAERVTLPDCGHMQEVECAPALVQVLLPFLRSGSR